MHKLRIRIACQINEITRRGMNTMTQKRATD